MSGDLSETDIGSEAQHPRSGVTATEEKLRNRLYELAMKMSEKETSSGEDQESEPKTESENHKESLSSEDNSQGVQEELKKVSAMKSPAGSSVCAASVQRNFYTCTECVVQGVVGGGQLSLKCPSRAHRRAPRNPC